MQKHVELFLLCHEADGKSPATLRWHSQSLSIFNKWLTEEDKPTDPNEWTPTLLREYFVFLQSRGWSGWTARNRASSVRAFCRWLFEEGLADTNIAERVQSPRRPSLHKQPFSDEEVHCLLDMARRNQRTGTRDVAILLFLLDSGVRLGELVGLRASHVFVIERTAIVRGKGGKDRAVFFGAPTAQALLKYELKRDLECESYFQTEEGIPLTAQGVRQIMYRLRRLTGIAEVQTHRFRRTFATNYLRNGGDSLMLQRTLGHTSLAMTNYYLSLVTDDLRAAHSLVSPVERLLDKRSARRETG